MCWFKNRNLILNMNSFSSVFVAFIVVVSVIAKLGKCETTKILEQTTITTTTNPDKSKIESNETNASNGSLQSQSAILTSSAENVPILKMAATESSVKPWTVLEYKPITSFYHPHPVTLAQIIPPGKPWPDSPPSTLKPTKHSTYQTTFPPILVDRFPELTTLTKRPTTTTTKKPKRPTKPQTVLEYVPSKPFFHPNPVTPAQIIPPGKPWPASPGHLHSSLATSTFVNLNDRLPDLTTTSVQQPETSTTINKSTTSISPVNEGMEGETSQSETTTVKETSSKETATSSGHTLLTYKPQRPWHLQKPENTINQIVPPGKPWPASPDGYAAFSVTTIPPWLKEIDNEGDDNISLSHSKVDNNLQGSKIDSSLVPNALQYYGGRVTAPSRFATSAPPFTSGNQKTTLSDLVDILKEVHNIMLVSGNAPPTPSPLLPFDNKNSPLNLHRNERGINSKIVTRERAD